MRHTREDACGALIGCAGAGVVICILSQSFCENTTEDVMQWLRHWGVACCRLNADDLTRPQGAIIEIRDGECVMDWESHGRRIRASEVDVVWFRRWTRTDRHGLEPPDVIGDERAKRFNQLACSTHLIREMRAVSHAVFASFSRARWLNHPRHCALNKLEVLRLAQRCGLDTPATLVTADPERVRQFAAVHGRLITKCADDLTVFNAADAFFAPATTEVDSESEHFRAWPGRFPSCFQERLDRAYEIRVFFIDGRCLASAYIFGAGQSHITDGRIANKRTTPFDLPAVLCERLGDLMQRLNLDLACIDMIKTRDDRWVFLEVNPTGQFWGDGCICHYLPEKRVAEALVRRLHESRCSAE